MAEIQQPTVDIFIVIIDQELAVWKSKNVSHMTWQIFVNIFSFILTTVQFKLGGKRNNVLVY